MNRHFLDHYGEREVPRFFENLMVRGATDQITIYREQTESDGAGGMIKTATAGLAPQSIPCLIRGDNVKDGSKYMAADQMTSIAPYMLTFPLVYCDKIIDVRPSDRLKAAAREDLPARTFRVVSIKNMGVRYEAYCELENAL